MQEGTPQGGPLSPFLFLIGLDPLLRSLEMPLTPNELVSAWADDIALICLSFPSRVLAYDILVAFASVSGLVLQRKKCAVIPLGSLDVEAWQLGLYDFLRAQHDVVEIPVIDGARYLGVWVGRGDSLDCTQLVQDKLRARAMAVADLGFGAPH
eukprot:3567317-Amphidinium_carterae.1